MFLREFRSLELLPLENSLKQIESSLLEKIHSRFIICCGRILQYKNGHEINLHIKTIPDISLHSIIVVEKDNQVRYIVQAGFSENMETPVPYNLKERDKAQFGYYPKLDSLEDIDILCSDVVDKTFYLLKDMVQTTVVN